MEGHKSRDADSLQKRERAGRQILTWGLQKQHSHTDTLVLAELDFGSPELKDNKIKLF